MMTVNLGKILEYLKIQESLRSNILTDYYLCKGIFLYVFLYPKRYHKSTNKKITEFS